MKTIKNIFKSKITYAVLACLLLVGVFAGITTLAEDVTPALSISGKNINHAENATVIYEVKIDNVDENFQMNAYGKLTMKFWTEAPESAAAASANVTADVQFTKYENGTQYAKFESFGFAPKDMTKPVYAAACYTDDNGESVYSEVVRYSVFEYLCEANTQTDKTAQQEALYAAMKDYITYAQKYLGYTESTSPEEIGYITVKNGYFTIIGEPEQYHYTTACIPAGTKYLITYDYAGLPYREDTLYTYTKITERINTVENGVAVGDLDRTFTISRIVDVNVPAIANTQIVEFNPSGATYCDGKLQLLAVGTTENTEGGTYTVTERLDAIRYATDNTTTAYHIWGITADATNDAGLPFSHWELADGTFYSNDIMILFNELDVVVNNSADSYEFKAVPVYAASDYSASTYTVATTNTNQTVTALEGNTGFIIDATAKTQSCNGSGYATATLPATAEKLDRFLVSYNVNVEKHADHDTVTTNNARKLLYGLNTGTSFNEVSLYIGGRAWELIMAPVEDCSRMQYTFRGYNSSDSAVTYKFNGSYSESAIWFGQDNKIEVYTEVVKSGNYYTIERTHLFINGYYCGFTAIPPQKGSPEILYNGAFKFNVLSNNNNKSKATYSDIKYFGFDAE